MAHQIDKIDTRIINFLKINGRMRNTEIAKKLGISESSVRNRLNQLISENYIQIVAVVNHNKLGYNILGSISLKVDVSKARHIANDLRKIDAFYYIARLTGAMDFDIEFNLKSQEDFRDLIDQIAEIDGVHQINSSIRIELVKHQYDWELQNSQDSLIQ